MRNPFKKRNNGNVGVVIGGLQDSICIPGYVPMDQVPEIVTAVRRIAQLIGSMTIYLMNSTEKGDFRIKNELSRLIDINPCPHMVRSTWMESIVQTMLLSGRGNAIVLPRTHNGYLASMEPISASRVQFLNVGYNDYRVVIDGDRQLKPDKVMHFVYNPDKIYPWKGTGVQVTLKDIAANLKQNQETTKAFMQSKWKPSVIISVDAMTETFQSKEGRDKILDDYITMDGQGKPWIIPDEQIKIETIKPLTLKDLAISETAELDKRAVAAFFGMPPFLLGVGEYDKDAWNSFIQNVIRPIAISIAQEITKKIITSPNWYVKLNVLSLMDWDLKTISDVFGSLSDRGFITGNEVRDRIGLSPIDGLDEVRILENYLPWEYSGLQKKLVQDGEEDAS